MAEDRPHLVRQTVPKLAAPSPALFDAAGRAASTAAEHGRLTDAVEAFRGIEQRRNAKAAAGGTALRAAAWNAERLKFAAPSARLVRDVAPDILFLTESDVGMARSGNRHTAADLADALGMDCAYGVEFLELGLGDHREEALHAGEANRAGFHGNAVLTRMPLEEPFLVRLDDGAVWWSDADGSQRRLGWRMAIGGRIRLGQAAVLVACVHLESRSDPADRAAQVRRLLDHVEHLAPAGPALIGGDFNTKRVPGDAAGPDWLADPSGEEPLFALLRAAGFEWRAANAPDLTQRTRPDGEPRPPFKRLDWLFTRGLAASHPVTVAAVDADGAALSDHDLVTATVRLPG